MSSVTKYKSAPEVGVVKGVVELLKSLVGFKLLIFILARNFIVKRYKGSYLGVLWTLMNPVLSMVGLALVFPLLMKFKVENYVLYIFSGILAWGMISGSIVAGGDSILENQFLLSKVYMPKAIFPLVVVFGELVNLLIAFFALQIVMLVFGYEVDISYLYLLCATVCLFVFCVGTSLVSSLTVVFFRDFRHMVGVFMQTIFYVSAIIFPINMLPEEYRIYMYFNPFYYFIELFHNAIYYGKEFDGVDFIVPMIIAVFMVALGVVLHWWFDKKIIYRL